MQIEIEIMIKSITKTRGFHFQSVSTIDSEESSSEK